MTMPLVDLTTSGFIHSNCARESLKVFARAQSNGVPLKDLSRAKLRRLTLEHISKNILQKFVIIPVTHSMNVGKHESKRTSYESSERRLNNPSL